MMEQLRWQCCFCELELAWHFINKDLHSQLINWALWEEYSTDLCQTKSTCLTRLPDDGERGNREVHTALEQLNTCLLGVRNWVCDLYHSGFCFRKVECSCGCIMKSIHTLLLNDEVCVGFVGARLLTHGIIDLLSGRSSRTGGSAVWEGSSGCIVCDTDSRTPDKTQSEFNLHKSRKTAHFWEEHTSVCFTFWQKPQNSHKMSLLKLPLPHKTEKMYEYVQVKIKLS